MAFLVGGVQKEGHSHEKEVVHEEWQIRAKRLAVFLLSVIFPDLCMALITSERRNGRPATLTAPSQIWRVKTVCFS